DLPVLLCCRPLVSRVAPLLYTPVQLTSSLKQTEFYKRVIDYAGFTCHAQTRQGLERRCYEALLHLARAEVETLRSAGLTDKAHQWSKGINAATLFRRNRAVLRECNEDRLQATRDALPQHKQLQLQQVFGQMMEADSEPQTDVER
ncbi:unnamed protein product, partial [Effrenium voratum]